MNRHSGLRTFFIIGISVLVFLRPLFSGLTYPWSNTYIQTVILILSLVWVLRVCWGKEPFFRTRLDIPVLTFFLLITVSSLKSVGSTLSLDFIYQFMSYVLLFFLVVNNLRTREAKRAVIFALLLSTAIVALYGIYQYYLGLEKTREVVQKYYSNEYPPEFMARLATNKTFSTFVFPPALAGFLLLVMPVSISMCLTSKKWWRVLLWLIPCLILFCMVLTFSKGGWLSCFLSMLVFVSVWLIVIKGIKKNVVAVGAAILILMFILLIVLGYLPKATFPGFIDSLGVRLGYWKSIPSMVTDFFLLGSGAGTFGVIYPGYRILLGRETQMAHNNYLQVLVETGVFGLVAFLWIWIGFLRRGFRLIVTETEKENRILILGCVIGIIGFLIHSFVDFGLYVPGITMTVFLFLGLVEAREGPPPARFSAKKGMKLLLTVIVLGVTLYMVWSVRKPMLGERCFARSLDSAKKGEIDKSISLLKEAIKYRPRHARYYFQLGALYEGKKGQIWLDRAIGSYEMAVKYNPYMPSYHSKLSFVYWFKSQGKNKKLMDKAIVQMEDAVSCYPVMPKYHKHLGRLYHLVGRYEEAKKEYMLVFEYKDAVYRQSGKAGLQQMLEEVGAWLSELENET